MRHWNPGAKAPLAAAMLAVIPLASQPLRAQDTEGEQQEGISPPVVEDVVVIARQREAAVDVVMERLEQDVPVDLMDFEQLARVGDSTVALALRRLPGVTLVNDNFVYVRGLGERYSSTTLNGAYVPSPDLTRNVIPLDIFPAEIIETLAVHKGYSPDRPAAFGGGNIDIRTRSIPDGPVLDFEIGTGWNSESDGDTLTYNGGGDDWLGEDDGTRAFPSALSQALQQYQGQLSPGAIFGALQRSGGNFDFADAEAINRQLATSLNRDINFDRENPDPDLSLQAVAGNSWYFGSEERWQLGVMGLVDYKNRWRNRDRINRSQRRPDTDVFSTRRSINQINLTGSINAGVSYGTEHSVEADYLFLRNTEDESTFTLGNNLNFIAADGEQLRSYGIRFEEREMDTFQLKGSHRLGYDTLALVDDYVNLDFARDLTFDWYWSDSTAETDIPNEVNISAEDQIDPATGGLIQTRLRLTQSAADYRWTELQDEVESYGWGLSYPVDIGDFNVTLSGGQDIYRKGRQYLQNQLTLGTSSAAPDALVGTPGDVLTDANILDPDNGYVLALGGIGTESYQAAEGVDAAWGKIDTYWRDNWRITAGARWEDFKQVSVPVDPLQFDTSIGKINIPPQELDSIATLEDDYYPSLALTYMRPGFITEEFQLRAAWSETVARPDLREISGATYIDPLTEFRIVGNSDLVTSPITNFDLRAEWFASNGDNFTISAFYKEIDRPIETVEGSATGDFNTVLTFINGEKAEIPGVEFEWLKSLDILSGALGSWTEYFFFSGNLTLSDPEITIGDQAVAVTNNTRPMTGASDYLVNLQLGYDSPGGLHSATMVFNTFGERLFFAGVNGAPDSYEQPFNSLDFIYSFYPWEFMTFKFRVQNMLDEDIEIEQGGVTIVEQAIGTTLRLDMAVKF